MDEIKSPEDILDEIMNRTPDYAPYPPPQFDQPAPDDIPPPLSSDAPEKTAAPSGAAKAVPWLCAALAVSLVMLGVCLFRMVKTSGQLAVLEASSAEVLAEAEQLRQENTALEQTQKRQQSRLAELQAKVREVEDSTQNFWASLYREQYSQRERLDYLWYLTQFMEHEDYPMAALIIAYWVEGGEGYGSNEFINSHTNAMQVVQYSAYRQQLIDQGYLKTNLVSSVDPGKVTLTEKWDPNHNPDMTALGILWCALNAHYVNNSPERAAQYLVEYQTYPLDNHGGSYPEYLRNTASDYTIELCEQLLSELIELEEYLTVEDGLLKYGPSMELSYNPISLPFGPPLYD